MTRQALATACCALLAAALGGCDTGTFQPAPPIMVIALDRLDFGAVAVGDQAVLPVQVQNQGKSDLKVAATLQGADGSEQDFTVVGGEEPIPPATAQNLLVTFRPTKVLDYQATLVVQGNDDANPRAELALTGSGYRRGAIEVEPTRLDFGLVNAGSAGLGQVIIRNVGNGDLVVTHIGLASGTNPDFAILSSTRTPATVPEKTEIRLSLAYRPGADSLPPADGALIIRAADPFQPETQVSLAARLNRAPVADAGPDQEGEPFLPVRLDGSLSTDADGNQPLRFEWSLTRVPEGSAAALADAATVQPTFTPDLVGVYQAELWVTDSTGLRSILPDRVLVNALPKERLLLELVWDSPIADLDLHFLAPGGTLGTASDCFYGNRDPDWGTPGDATDDPALLRDDLAGFGPETIGYASPLSGIYQVTVDYFAAHTPSGTEPTTATLRVFVDGSLMAEIGHRLESQGQRWKVVTVQWPEGSVTPVDQVE
jgi:hypothetical protein